MVPATWPLPNVHLGVSCEDQQRADERIPLLLQTPAAVRFVSAEPLLGPIDFWCIRDGSWHDAEGADFYHSLRGASFWSNGDHGIGGGPTLDQVIVGGESGPGARPCNVEWIRSIVRQCREAGVAAFVKQVGARVIGNEGEFSPKNGRVLDDDGWQQQPKTFRLRSPKGGDPSEWPEDLRVREDPCPR